MEIAITDRQLLEILERFPNYKEGDASIKLYIKNIAKSVTQEQLSTLFQECNVDTYAKQIKSMKRGYLLMTYIVLFRPETVDLKTKGRMRGQAFVTFATIDSASRALSHIHGLVLENKPLIVVCTFIPLPFDFPHSD